MDARLRVLSGPHAGETFEVKRGKLLIGREEDCHLRPDSEFVSRHHCVVLLDDYTLRVRDLGSKNGTFVNGRRIGGGETILLHDDIVAIGEMTCQVDLALPAAVHPVVDPAASTVLYNGDTVQAEAPLPGTELHRATPVDASSPISIGNGSHASHETQSSQTPGL
jgi:pSer/pThr/pTyr-binding forkhead associated (FHA) protein